MYSLGFFLFFPASAHRNYRL